MTTPIVRGVWIQRPTRNRVLGAIWGGLALASVGVAVVAFASPDDTFSARAVFALCMLLPAAGFARLARGYARGGVMVTDGGEVVVQGPWSRRRFPQSEVTRFEAGLHPGPRAGNPGPGIVMVLRDGTRVPIYALGNEGLVWNMQEHVARWEESAARLTALL